MYLIKKNHRVPLELRYSNYFNEFITYPSRYIRSEGKTELGNCRDLGLNPDPLSPGSTSVSPALVTQNMP